MRSITVLSLFDGISLARLSLADAKFHVGRYIAVENNPSARAIANHQWRRRQRLIAERPSDDVMEYTPEHGLAVDLLIAGVPCTSFSKAGNRSGDGMVLFEKVAELMQVVKPRMVMIECTPLGKYQAQVDRMLGLPGVKVNAAAYGPQNRVRCFWARPAITPRVRPSNMAVREALAPHWGYAESRMKTRKFTPFPHPAGRLVKMVGYVGDELKSSWGFGVSRGMQVISFDGKAVAITAKGDRQTAAGYYEWGDGQARLLSLREIERLQGLPSFYACAPGVSMHQRLKAIGNGWYVPMMTEFLMQLYGRTFGYSGKRTGP